MRLVIFDLKINNGKNQIIVTVTSRGFLAKRLMGVFNVRCGFVTVGRSNN